MDIFEILSMDERVIVYSSLEDRSLITWNQSATLQWWRPVVRLESYKFDPNDWEEVAILTLSHSPRNFKEAREAAIRWQTGQ
jgi:hypothetical protein